MSEEHNGVSEREYRLDEVLGGYFEALAAGRAPDRQELLARHPDLADDLTGFFADQEAVDRWTESLRPAAQEALTEAVAAALTPPAGSFLSPTPDAPLPFGGGYELLEEIGRGGMGVVYRARQKVPSRLVALKAIRAGWLAAPAEVQRFRAEAEAAASLDHPNIVPIYEVGEHHGQPFFSTRLVEGGSLAGQLDRFREVPRAARLVVILARAVHHAHQRGILHRDLKPSNVLLDREGRPHVADFGLAKRLEADVSLTESGALVGTPSYMAPEQAAGRKEAVTTATDVYGLGAVLYALLTGRPPFRADTAVDTLLLVREREPEPPRRINARVDRDLETVCLRCLHKDPARRYGSAEALADDLERWLAGKPILARRAGPRERLWKWVKRRPALAGLIALGAVAGLGLAGGVVGHNAQLRAAAEKARHERDAAEEERRWAGQAVEDMYTQVAEKWLKQQPRLEPVQQEFLEKALRYYTHEAALEGDHPEIRVQVAGAQYRLGAIYSRLGRNDEAREAYSRAIALFERLVTEPSADAHWGLNLAESYYGLGTVAQGMGRQDEAAGAYRNSMEAVKRAGGATPGSPELLADLIKAQDGLAGTLAATGKAPEAERLYRDAIDQGSQLVKKPPGKPEYSFLLANTHNNLAILLHATGRDREAEPEAREAVRLFAKLAEDNPTEPDYRERCAFSLGNLAAAAMAANRLQEAEPLLRQAVALQKRLTDDFPVVPDFQWELATSQVNLGIVLKKQGDSAGAEASYDQAIAGYRKLADRYPAVPEYRQGLGRNEHNLGNLLAGIRGRLKEAEQAYDRAVEVEQKLVADVPKVPAYREDLARTLYNLGRLLAETGRAREAEAPLARACQMGEDLVAAAPKNRDYRSALAETCLMGVKVYLSYQGPPGSPDARRAVALAQRATELEPQHASHWLILATAHYRAGNWKETLDAMQKGRDLGSGHDAPEFFAAMAHWQLGDKDQARRRFRQAAAWMDQNAPRDERLRRIRAEAAQLLGIEEPPVKAKEESAPKK